MDEDKLKGLDSKVLFEIPRDDLDIVQYRNWMDNKVMKPWLVDQEGNKEYAVFPPMDWLDEDGVSGTFLGSRHRSKFHKLDGQDNITSVRKQGVMIRDHYHSTTLVNVHQISDSFEKFLINNSIQYTRINYKR